MSTKLSKGQIGFWNCCGGLRSKFYFIKDFLYDVKPSLFFVSESELREHEIGVFSVSGYDLLTANTIANGGKSRVVCYVQSGIKYKQLKVKTNHDIIALDIEDSRIIGLYRGFKLNDGETRSSFFHTIIKNLHELSRTDRHLMIGGDFNVNLFKKTADLNDLHNWAIEFGLLQITDKYTWRRIINGVLHQSALDHVYTNEPGVELSHVNSISDHDILLTTKTFAQNHRRKIILRDWRGYTKEEAQIQLNDKLAQISTDIDEKQLTEALNDVLDELAPKRVIKVRTTQIVSQKLEKLKKKRDRKYRAFKKTKNNDYLVEVTTLNKEIKRTLRQETSKIFQDKAKSSDPKTFWQAVNQSLGKDTPRIFEIDSNGASLNNFEDIANCFADFFKDKVQKLSSAEVTEINLSTPTKPMRFSLQELERVFKNISSKKCFGTDGIPQNLLKDVFKCIPTTVLNIVNKFASEGLPDSLKEARVIPLHKKGSKTDVANYRPISNVCSLSKIYERCILQRLEAESPNLEGQHQHGFRQKHSTETALATLQSYIANILESKRPGIVYSVDLSAAFDLLKPDKFFELFKDDLSEGLMFSLMDFLQNRRFHVEVNGEKSRVLSLDRGCVQGSVLGPRLFSMYVGKLEEALVKINTNIKLISYADDSYVLITGETEDEVVSVTESVVDSHIRFLRDLGMVVNDSKTELMWIGRSTGPRPEVKIMGNTCEPVSFMKALGILIDGTLSWDHQAERAISTGQKLVSVFRFLRKQMTEEQFLKTVTANYYSSVFYCSSVWHPNIKAIYKAKLTSLHFRLLRTACRDFNSLLSRDQLSTRCKKATPNEWSKYTTASLAMRIHRDKCPRRLHEILMRTFYTERRNRGKGLFFDGSKSRAGRQSIQNRLAHIAQVTEPWSETGSNLTKDRLRVLLKSTYFLHNAIKGTVGDLAPQRVAPSVPLNIEKLNIDVLFD